MIVLPRCSFYPAIEACETESRNRASCLVFYELLENRSSCENLLSDLPTSILCFARRECEQVYDKEEEEGGRWIEDGSNVFERKRIYPLIIIFGIKIIKR